MKTDELQEARAHLSARLEAADRLAEAVDAHVADLKRCDAVLAEYPEMARVRVEIASAVLELLSPLHAYKETQA